MQSRHAEIAYVLDDCAFYLRCIEGMVFANQKEVKEVILEHGDLLEFGKNGPRKGGPPGVGPMPSAADMRLTFVLFAPLPSTSPAAWKMSPCDA